VVDPPVGQPGAGAMLRPGPGQNVHQLDVEMPGELASSREVQAFHDSLSRRLQSKKKAPKKRR
jgi:hypothetical protein